MVEARVKVVHVDAERGFSGGEVQVLLLLEGLRELGLEGILACPPGSACERAARERSIECRPAAMRSELDGPAVLALARILREERADLAHLHTGRAAWLGGWAARLAGVPALVTRRMDREVRPGARTRLLYGALCRRVAAISPSVERALRAGGVDPRRIRVIPSAVDPRALRPRRPRAVVRAELGAREDDVVLLALGALVRRKGHDLLLGALAALRARGPRPALWVAGEGAERAALERRARELELDGQVRFLGQRADAADLLAACDALVMPSRREGLGVAALEASAIRSLASSSGGSHADHPALLDCHRRHPGIVG